MKRLIADADKVRSNWWFRTSFEWLESGYFLVCTSCHGCHEPWRFCRWCALRQNWQTTFLRTRRGGQSLFSVFCTFRPVTICVLYLFCSDLCSIWHVSQSLNFFLFQQTRVLRFIVAVFMADDSVGVWELKSRNSGHDEAIRCYPQLLCNGRWLNDADFDRTCTRHDKFLDHTWHDFSIRQLMIF